MKDHDLEELVRLLDEFQRDYFNHTLVKHNKSNIRAIRLGVQNILRSQERDNGFDPHFEPVNPLPQPRWNDAVSVTIK